MDDLDISYRLALAIGYPKSRVRIYPLIHTVKVVNVKTAYESMKVGGKLTPILQTRSIESVFDYRDPTVIWPIAEKFGLFPSDCVDSQDNIISWECLYYDKLNRKYQRTAEYSASRATALAAIDFLRIASLTK